MFLGLLFLLFILVIIAVALAGTIFWIWMIVDCAQNRFLDSNTRLVWILVIVFTHFVGALIYYFAGRRPSNAVTTPYNGYAQGPAQYTPNQQHYNQPPYGAAPYAPPPPNNYGNMNQNRGYQPQQPPYYDAPRASYPDQQAPRPQE